MLLRWLRERRPRFRTGLLINSTLITLGALLAIGLVLLSLYQVRFRILRASALTQHTSILGEVYITVSQALIVADEARHTEDGYQFQFKLIPILTILSQERTELDNLLRTLPPEDPLFTPMQETRSLLTNIIRSLREAMQLAAEGQWASVDLRLQNLKTLYTEAQTNFSTFLQITEEQAQATREDLRRASLQVVLFPVMLSLFIILATWGTTGYTLRNLIRPVENLVEQLARFGQGDLSLRLPEPRRPAEMYHLAHTFNRMADRLQEAQLNLEQRVEERTRALQRRTQQLQAAAEIGRAATTIRDLDTLLQEATHLISQRFGFYHVGIFLLDENGEYAVLRAANSEGGRRMLARGHRLKVGEQGIVGYVTGTGRPRIALDVGKDAVHFNNPDLPLTRSEMALPLTVGDRIIGALDVQSTEAGAFSEDDIAALQTMADLLAVAIENAHLFTQTQEALANMQRAYALATREGWSAFMHSRRVQGYRVDAQGQVHPVELPTTARLEAASASSKAKEGEAEAPETLLVPVRVRGVQTAWLKLRKPSGHAWRPDERRLVHALSERLGAALESARLYAEAQRRAAQLQATAEIARDTSQTLDLSTLLREAVELVRDRFGFYHASVFLVDESGEYAVLQEATGEAGAQMKARGHRLAVGSRSIVGQATATGQPVVVNDTRSSDIHRPNPLLPETRAELALPLKIGDQVIGALDVQSTEPNAFTEEDIQVLRILADQLAVAVEKARLFAETQEHLEHHRALHQVLAAAAAAHTIEEALQHSVHALHVQRPEDRVAILIADPQEQVLRVLAEAGHGPQVLGLEIPFGQGLTGWAAAHRQAIRVGDVNQDARYIEGSPGVYSEMSIPLIYGNELLGVIDLENPRRNAYDEHDEELLKTLATSLAAVLTNLRLLETARRRSEALQLLNEVTAAAAAHLTADEIFDDILPRLRRGLSARSASAFLWRDGRLELFRVYPPEAEADHPGICPVSEEALAEGRVRYASTESPLLAPMRETLEKLGLRAVLALPLIVRGEPLGALQIGLAEMRSFSEEDLRLFEQIGRQVATSLEVANLFQRTVRRAEREHLVAEITTKLRATNDPRVILETAVAELQRALHSETVQVLLQTAEPGNGSNGEG